MSKINIPFLKMKIVKITEGQYNRLFEAYDGRFSLSVLKGIGKGLSLKEEMQAKYDYCVKTLGNPFAKGSSRCVFMINDNIVLKLAYVTNDNLNYKTGFDQNRNEVGVYNDNSHSKLLPQIYAYDENYSYVVCEHVLPAEDEDFEKILGIPFYHLYVQNSVREPMRANHGDRKVGYNKYFDDIKNVRALSQLSFYDIVCYMESNFLYDEPIYDENIENFISKSSWLCELSNFIEENGNSDFASIENYGLVNRDGRLQLVLLDTGLNLETWDEDYG